MIKAVAGSAVALALAGCQRFEPAPLSATRGGAVLEARGLTEPGLKAFIETSTGHELIIWPLSPWDFETLTLAAFYFHPSLDVARAQWGVAKAGIVTAGGRPNPSITLTPEYSFNPPAGVSPWLPSVSFSVPIETAGKRGHRIARAKELSEAARLNISSAAWQVRSRLRTALLQSNSARQRESLLQQQYALHEKIVTQLERRLQAGTISSFEAASARINLAKAKAELENLRTSSAEALARLAEAVGVPAAALSDLTIQVTWPQPSDTELASAEMRGSALQSRPDILAGLADYAASEAALQLEVAKQYPDVQLGSGYQWDQGEHKWSIGLTMELPLLNRNEGPIAEAKAKRIETAARFDALQARAIAEIDLATAGYRGARANVATLDALLAAQEKQRTAVAAHFKAGAADQLEVLNAEAELAAAQLLRLEAQAKAASAFGNLEDAIQRPFDALSLVEQNPRVVVDRTDYAPRSAQRQ
ncbi:MAG TPA: TolC family protein [Verrucomicrobiae bacterium]|nr:TolC family protein [Verrucomicrobiae bacterium]